MNATNDAIRIQPRSRDISYTHRQQSAGLLSKRAGGVQRRSRLATVISRELVWHNKGIRKPDIGQGSIAEATPLLCYICSSMGEKRTAGWLDQRPAHRNIVTWVTTIQKRSTLSFAHTRRILLFDSSCVYLLLPLSNCTYLEKATIGFTKSFYYTLHGD